MLDSLDLLAAGTSVTATTIRTGYTTPSAHVTAFKRELGVTPRHLVAP